MNQVRKECHSQFLQKCVISNMSFLITPIIFLDCLVLVWYYPSEKPIILRKYDESQR